MARVLNRRDGGVPSGAVYVGRPSKWGNPKRYSRGELNLAAKTPSRAERILMDYEDWLRSRPELMAALPELAGKDLVCWCAPAPCHADVLLRLASRSAAARTEQGE